MPSTTIAFRPSRGTREAADGVAPLELLAVALQRHGGFAPPDRSSALSSARRGSARVGASCALVLGLEALLLVCRVERRERVLPLPDGERPGGGEQPRGRAAPCRRCGGPASLVARMLREAAIAVPDRPAGGATCRRWIRPVAAAGDREHLAGDGGPGEEEDDPDVRTRSRWRSAPQGTRARRGRARSGGPSSPGAAAALRGRRRRATARETRAVRRACDEPEPRMRGGKDEEQRVDIRGDQHKRDRRRARRARRPSRRSRPRR